jgi:hypothetical protein
MTMYKQIKNMFNEVSTTAIVRLSDNATIPCDEANTDYQTYLKWLEEGNTPLPAENT